ncbi:HD domain-containing protein [Streptomonospora sp. S1-112]|uniref:HD domain-containing protein n=1 Tax=Streptomonospora mangrovi TaxID=2883123 RepID=A0A9X3NIE1_9ACTN|nr:HD domain-containing protein [Streptomonospora mangrovi]MDA0563620.1 HD domain-containing protein [Streptomonospora mangrovi]
MRLPTDEEIRALHVRHAPTPEALELVYTHCEIVCGIAEQLLDTGGFGLDRDLVRAGSLLHDIGVYRLYDAEGRLDHSRYVAHGVLGHALLEEDGLPQALCRFCSCHTGMGLTSRDVLRQHLPIPVGDYLAESEEEALVMYADKFHSKTDPPVFLTPAAYAATLRRFGKDKVSKFAAMRERFGEPDLTPFIDKYGHALV